jgi:hypothetical protein
VELCVAEVPATIGVLGKVTHVLLLVLEILVVAVMVGVGQSWSVVAMCALAMTVAMELLAPSVESFDSGEPRVFLDMAKILVLLVVVMPPLSCALPLTVALLFLVTIAAPGRLQPKPANQQHL